MKVTEITEDLICRICRKLEDRWEGYLNKRYDVDDMDIAWSVISVNKCSKNAIRVIITLASPTPQRRTIIVRLERHKKIKDILKAIVDKLLENNGENNE